MKYLPMPFTLFCSQQKKKRYVTKIRESFWKHAQHSTTRTTLLLLINLITANDDGTI